MKNMLAECRNIARAWQYIDPPASFDPARATHRT
jgi:hypothetical protein